MKLQNPFPLRVRLLYIDCHACFFCGRNGQGVGGLEINHIFGRESAAAFNASVLCGRCHGHVGHSREEHQRLFFLNLRWLLSQLYIPLEDDLDLVRRYPWLTETPEWRELFAGES